MPTSNEVAKLQAKVKRLEKQLELQVVNADAIIASIGDGIITTDNNGRISKINDVALELLGYDKSEVVGKWFHNVVNASDIMGNPLAAFERPITQAMMSSKPVSRKLLLARKNGDTIPVSVTVSPILLQGTPIGAVELIRDITTDYEINKMKDDFISIASHQLRTPATGVKQYIAMALDGYAGELTEAQQQMLKKAYDSNERQLRIVDDLLRVAHLDAGQIILRHEPIDILALVEDVVREQHVKFSLKNQKLRVDCSGENFIIQADQSRLRMVIENMLDNAGKYSPEHTRITITLSSTPKELSITIQDQGIGMSEKEQEKLFKKFSRIETERSREVSGSGLGLYWAKKIIDLHDGKIKVTSAVNAGSKFVISLPLSR